MQYASPLAVALAVVLAGITGCTEQKPDAVVPRPSEVPSANTPEQPEAAVAPAPIPAGRPLPKLGTGAPDWLKSGSGAFEQDGKRLLVGVGWTRSVGNSALARSSADNRARAEIARLLANNKEHAGVLLRFVQVRDHWQDSASKTLYARAELDLGRAALSEEQVAAMWQRLHRQE